MRRISVAFFALALLAPASGALAQSRGLNVEVNHITRLNLNGSAASVIVGNPQVADVTVVDAHTLYVSGRASGVTEIAVLDGLGRTIYQGEVIVSGPASGQVRVWRGAAVTHMACGNTCSPSGADASGPTMPATPATPN